jgi:hypothetical protein
VNPTAPGVPLHLFETGNEDGEGAKLIERARVVAVLDGWAPGYEVLPGLISDTRKPSYVDGATCILRRFASPEFEALGHAIGVPVGFDGATPDAARLAAARAIYPELPADVRAKSRPRPFTAAFYGSQSFTLEQLEQRRIEREKRAAEREAGLPDKATCDVHGCKSLQRFDSESSIAPPTWAQVTLVDADGETEDFTLCAEHAQKVKAVLTGAL